MRRWFWLAWAWLYRTPDAMPCGCYRGKKPPRHRSDEPCLKDRPGNDEQWSEWVHEGKVDK
jgi:hypothetical protein